MPNSIEEIGAKAFAECPLLTDIELPENLKKLDATAFDWKNVKTTEDGDAVYAGTKNNPHWILVEWKNKNTIPEIADDVQGIGPGAYQDNLAVTNIKIKDGITAISADCFKGCKNLKTVELPSSIKRITQEAFHASHVEKVILNEGLEEIETCAFWNVKELKSIEIPSSVKTIGHQSFEGCGLEEVILNEGLNSIAHYAFQKCSNLKEITLPASLKSLAGSAFFATGISKVTFKGTGVTFIDNNTFKDCPNLTTIVADTGDEEGVIHLPSNIIAINNEAFAGCKSIKAIDLSKNVSLEKIKDKAFENCASITNFGVAPFVKEVAQDAFAGANNITELTLPKGVSKIDVSLVKGAKINKVYFNGTLADWAQIPRSEVVFKEKFDLYIQGEKLENLVVGDDDATVVEPYAFANVNLENIEIRPNLTKLGDGAFYGVGKLWNLTVECGEDGKEDPLGNAFVCDGGEDTVFADNITITGSDVVISADTFKGIEGAFSVKFGKTVKKIEKGALKPLANHIEEIYLPFLGETISDTKNNYFGYVFGLDDYQDHETKLPTGIKKVQVYNAKVIGEGAFYEAQIDELILPSDVTMVERNAFTGAQFKNSRVLASCDYLPLGGNEYGVLLKVDTDKKSFEVAPECKFIVAGAFNNLPKLKEITISDTVVKIEPYAIANCKKVGKVTLLNTIGWHVYNDVRDDSEPYAQKSAGNAKRVAKDVKGGYGLIKLDVERKY